MDRYTIVIEKGRRVGGVGRGGGRRDRTGRKCARPTAYSYTLNAPRPKP